MWVFICMCMVGIYTVCMQYIIYVCVYELIHIFRVFFFLMLYAYMNL